jgi:hypothetical protein
MWCYGCVDVRGILWRMICSQGTQVVCGCTAPVPVPFRVLYLGLYLILLSSPRCGILHSRVCIFVQCCLRLITCATVGTARQASTPKTFPHLVQINSPTATKLHCLPHNYPLLPIYRIQTYTAIPKLYSLSTLLTQTNVSVPWRYL